MEKVIYCANCNCVVEGSKGKMFLLSTKFPATDFDVTFAQSLKKSASMINKRIEIEPVNVVINKSRSLSRECRNEISTGMTYISAFIVGKDLASYVSSKLLGKNMFSSVPEELSV
jgi:hypothetical protein